MKGNIESEFEGRIVKFKKPGNYSISLTPSDKAELLNLLNGQEQEGVVIIRYGE